MPHIFKGNLKGYLCDECYDYLSGVKVKLYRLSSTTDLAVKAVLPSKETFHRVDEKELESKQDFLIAETTSDQEGNFIFQLDDTTYHGDAFDIDFECGTPPSKIPAPPRPKGTLQFHLTTVQPVWRASGNDQIFGWEYALPVRWWCAVLAWFDIWTVCGRVIDCDTKKPIQNVQVDAFDVDLIQDDALGSDLTDSGGYFRIQFPGSVFRQTLIPWLNIEYPSGPDLYFHVSLPGTSPTVYLLKEPRSEGNAAGRKNVGFCTCVKLCVKAGDVPPTNKVTPLFHHVGNYSLASGFDADGFAIPGQHAFTQTIELLGDLPGGTNSNSVEYRFRVFDVPGAEIPWATLKAKFPAFSIGKLQRQDTGLPPSPTYPWESVDVLINPAADADSDGWIKVPRQNDASNGGVGVFIPKGVLGRLDTSQLVAEFFDLTNPLPAHEAGNPIPASDLFAGANHTYKIVFEAREVSTASPVLTNTLAQMVVWNGNAVLGVSSDNAFKVHRHPSWAGGVVNLKGVCMLDIQELIGAGCSKIGGTMTIRCSIYHPYLESASMTLTKPSGPGPVAMPAVLPHGVYPGQKLEIAMNQLLTFATTDPACAYVLKVSCGYRLTNGYNAGGGAYFDEDLIAFCKS